MIGKGQVLVFNKESLTTENNWMNYGNYLKIVHPGHLFGIGA